MDGRCVEFVEQLERAKEAQSQEYACGVFMSFVAQHIKREHPLLGLSLYLCFSRDEKVALGEDFWNLVCRAVVDDLNAFKAKRFEGPTPNKS